MPRTVERPPPPRPASGHLRLGFLALNDAAPLIVAYEQGLFAKHNVHVQLSREVGWATVRDKIIYGELHAAHALAGMLVSTKLGLGCQPCDCLTACVLSSNGNAITLSESLWTAGVRDAESLREHVLQRRHDRPLVLGVVFHHSTHHLHLCDWLRAAGIHPRRDVRVVVVPPPQVFRNLVAGTIDGYCVGEPWNSVAVREKAGWCAAFSCDLAPTHPEKVLMVRHDFAAHQADEHLALVAAITEAAELCDQPDFRPELVQLLARREYLNLPERTIAAGLVGPFDVGHGATQPVSSLVTFGRDGACEPQPAKIEWLIDGFRRHGLLPADVILPRHLGRDLFRPDLFHQALQRHRHPLHHENTPLTV